MKLERWRKGWSQCRTLADPVVAGDGSTAHESRAQPNQESRYNHEEENVIPINILTSALDPPSFIMNCMFTGFSWSNFYPGMTQSVLFNITNNIATV